MARPTGITFLAVVAIVGGVVVILLSGMIPVLGNEPLAAGEPQVLAVALVLGAILSIAFGIAAWFTRSWAYWLGIAAAGLLVVAGAIGLWRNVVLSGTPIALGLGAGLLYLLVRPKVRRAFVLASTPPAPPPAPPASQKRSAAPRRKTRRR